MIESDEEFLKRMEEIRKNADNKGKNELKKYTEEYEEGKKKGKETGKMYTELDECYKLIEEFKKNPPILTTKHVNGVSIKREYDKKYVEKIKLLKKHHFPFRHIIHDISINSPHFKVYGTAYLIRNGIEIKLPQDSLPPIVMSIHKTGMGSQALDSNNEGIILKKNDIIRTETNSCLMLNDTKNNDEYKRKIFILPNSEVKINLSSKKSSNETQYLKSEIIDYNILNFSLVKGLFKIDVVNKNTDVNKVIKINEIYPKIEFLNTSKTIENITNKIYENMKKDPKMIPFLSHYKIKSSNEMCDEISTYIELNEDDSLVIFGTFNPVKYNNKIATINLNQINSNDLVSPEKITIKEDKIYSDKSERVDPRVKSIIKYSNSIEIYNSMLESKKEIEEEIKNKDVKNKKIVNSADNKDRLKELEEEMKYMKKVNDEFMVESIKMQIDEIKNPSVNIVDEELIIQNLEKLNKEIEKLRPDINSNFPKYNSVSESDLI